MTSTRAGMHTSALAWWAAATIFVSAFLLFQVQPVISKAILPWFGGSPAVWTTCVLFFQLVLLAGYAYAHGLIRYVSPNWQGTVHAVLLLLAIATLPITPSDFWKPHDGSLPALRILLLLAAKVGLPYFLLSSSGPLVQAWFARTYPGTSPYRLYALSNVGSLLALLTYPVLIEPLLGVYSQGLIWSVTFIGFALFAGLLGWQVSRLVEVPPSGGEAKTIEQAKPNKAGTPTVDDEPASGGLMLAWIALPALASMLFLATTNHLCQDIAVVPFMWIVPLSLYLVTFILCFDSEIWYQRKIWGLLGLAAILALCVFIKGDDWKNSPLPASSDSVLQSVQNIPAQIMHFVTTYTYSWGEAFEDNLVFQALVYIVLLFIICMLCHGELVKLKPKPQQLTLYYLMISVGGALGGLFVALICPLIFRQQYELSLGIVCGYVVAWIALVNDGRSSWLDGKQWLQWALAFSIMGGVVFVIGSTRPEEPAHRVAVERNFYGSLTVLKHMTDEDGDGEYADLTAYRLRNGGILHGYQFADDLRRYEATTYYKDDSGASVAVNDFPRAKDAEGKFMGIRVGVVGLGCGTMAAHARRDDVYRFYEIDPKVISMSEKYFTFRQDAEDRGAKTEVVSGDARIQMELEPDQNYDVIILDAFSGDAIPAHLLTVESLEIYKRHLRKDASGKIMGILAIHISNRHLNLAPVVSALARRNSLSKVFIQAEDSQFEPEAFTSSDWILLTQNQDFLKQDMVQQNNKPLAVAEEDEVLWTDQHSSLLPILNSEWVKSWRSWWQKKPAAKKGPVER